jgi:tRNA nucleotidyltransferase (CCA-adding enzyme)
MPDPGPRLPVAATIDPPVQVREIAATLEGAGFETWCVGGAVRDALLGLRHLDWDLATAAAPRDVQRLFRRTVPVGIEFGTVGVLDRDGRMHEVTTFRRDVRTDGRHAVVEFGVSLDDDLARRDFTINAIAYSAATNELRDPFGGRTDLEARRVRAVGDPRERMREDRLRALRALRFAGRFGFAIAPETWAAIVESAPWLGRLSRERVKQELEKTMEQVCHPGAALALWRRAGALRELLPVLAALPDRALDAADRVGLPDATGDPGRKRRRTLVRLAALFSGCEPGATRRALRELRFSNRDGDWVALLAGAARDLGPAVRDAVAHDEHPAADLRRWASRTGRVAMGDVLRVALAVAGPADERRSARGHAVYRRALRVAYRDPVEVADLAVDGDDLLREAGLAAGPAIGATLRRLLAWVVEEPARNTRDQLVEAARGWQATDKATES